jgi:hypothetical protein
VYCDMFASFKIWSSQIASGLGLIAVAKTVDELCTKMGLPNKDEYTLWSHETSPDFETDNEDEMHTFHYEMSRAARGANPRYHGRRWEDTTRRIAGGVRL